MTLALLVYLAGSVSFIFASYSSGADSLLLYRFGSVLFFTGTLIALVTS